MKNLNDKCRSIGWWMGKSFSFAALGRLEEWIITRRKVTSTKNFINAITKGKAVINNVLCYQTMHNHVKVYPINDSKFIDNLIALQSNLFVETLNWEYERVNNPTFGEFMIFCNCGKRKYRTGYSAHLRVNDDVSADEVEKILSIKNEREE